LTKSDKLNRRDAVRVLKETNEACRDAAVTVQLFSALAKQGFEDARGIMDEWLEGSAQKKAPVGA
jgi:GTP-binding protein EngB required for normal cell division